MAVQLLFSWVLLSAFDQDSTQHSCVVPIEIFLNLFCLCPCGSRQDIEHKSNFAKWVKNTNL